LVRSKVNRRQEAVSIQDCRWWRKQNWQLFIVVDLFYTSQEVRHQTSIWNEISSPVGLHSPPQTR